MFYTQKKRFFNLVHIMYVHSMEQRAVRLLSKHYDLTNKGTNFWKLESTLVHQIMWKLS